MIDQKLTTYFSRFKNLAPRSEFISSSKTQIISEAQESRGLFVWRSRFFESITVGGALAMASLLIMLVIGGVSFLTEKTGSVATTSSDPDAQALLHEASRLASSVQIKEVDRFTESAEQVVSALDALSRQTRTQ